MPEVPTRVTLHVAAASDLQLAMPVLVERYRAEHPDVQVVLTFGASGQLAEQVRAGAPFGVFLSANESYVKNLASESYLIPDSIQPYAVGSLVIATLNLRKNPPASLNDLTRPDFHRIAIANPETAPFGSAARQALQNAKVWSKIRLGLVFAESVRQALQFVETGNAEAALVSKALIQGDRFQVVTIDPADYDPIIQWLGVVAKLPTEEIDEARRFVQFVLSDQGRGVLEGFGMKGPKAVVTPPASSEVAGPS